MFIDSSRGWRVLFFLGGKTSFVFIPSWNMLENGGVLCSYVAITGREVSCDF